MADAQRWSVTYTKHVRQKRKVYQDGVLELQASRRKVILYDEGDKLLESRFVKKEDVIKSGETLAFDSYLVDIGELSGGHKPTSRLTCQEKDSTVTDKQQSSHSYDCQSNSTSVGRKPTFGKVKERKINCSPSANLIRGFRGREMNKYVSLSCSADIMESTTTEWKVLYTTQITQKAKKFHDGVLRLTVRGSLGRQVMLYDVTKQILESRFLKKHEFVCSGELLAFEGHLVEIGEQKGDKKAATDSRLQAKDCKIIGKTDIANCQAKLPTHNKFPAGKTPEKTSPEKHTNYNNSSYEVENAYLSRSATANEPKRAVHDILSVLRKPILIKDATMDQTSVAEQHEPFAEGCNGHRGEEVRETDSDYDSRIKVLKPETIEVLAAAENCAAYKNGRECQARSSSFCLSSATTYGMTPILNVEGIDYKKLVSTSTVEPCLPVSAVLGSDKQKPIELATFPKSNEVVETDKHPEIFSCEEIMTETKAAATICLSSSKFPQEHGEEMDEFPSFDLGF